MSIFRTSRGRSVPKAGYVPEGTLDLVMVPDHGTIAPGTAVYYQVMPRGKWFLATWADTNACARGNHLDHVCARCAIDWWVQFAGVRINPPSYSDQQRNVSA